MMRFFHFLMFSTFVLYPYIFQFPVVHRVWGLLTYLRIIHHLARQKRHIYCKCLCQQSAPLRCWILGSRFSFIQLCSCGSSSEKLSVVQAESCQVGSTIFPLEFISPTTCGKGALYLSVRKWEEKKQGIGKSLLFSSFVLVLCICWWASHLSSYILFRSLDQIYLSSLLLLSKQRFVTGHKKANSEEGTGQIALNVETLVLKAAWIKQKTLYQSITSNHWTSCSLERKHIHMQK